MTGQLRGGHDPSAMGRRPRRRYPWVEVRRSYVEGWLDEDGRLVSPTLGEVAERFGIAPGRVRAVAASHRWTQTRDAYFHALELQRRDLRVRDLADAAWAADEAAMEAAARGLHEIGSRLEQLSAEVAAGGKLDVRELLRLAKTGLALQEVGLTAVGLSPTRRGPRSP